MATAITPDDYREMVADVRVCVRAHVPAGAVVLVVSKGDEELIRIDGYRGWHFPRDAWGAYAGHHPGSSLEAIALLRRLYAQGARYLVFPATASWWLDHYRELADLLDSAHHIVAREDSCVIYELRDSASFDALLARDESNALLIDLQPRVTMPLASVSEPLHRQPLRVLSIVSRFGKEKWGSADQELTALFARQMPEVARDTLIVDNALPLEYCERHDATTVVGGDNSSREFSAFDRAVGFIGGDIWSYDFVHFATDAFNALYVAYLERFDTALLQALVGRPACVGHIDCYNEPIHVQAYRSQHWMRSCFFFLPPTEVMALGSFVTVSDGRRFFTGHPARPFRADAPLSGRYREYILQWLTGHGVGQGVEWHSAFALGDETIALFEQKARAILNEHLLSIRLQALGCHLLDVTWLSALLRQREPLRIPLTTSWREQLANRDRDRLVVSDVVSEAAHAVSRV